MRIISLNTWGGRLIGELSSFIKNINADILCLQEIYVSPNLTKLEIKDEKGVFFRPNLMLDLEKLLPNHVGLFFPFASGYINDSTTTDSSIFYGIATFVHRNIPLIYSHTDFVYGQFQYKSSKISNLPRNMHCMRIWNYNSNSSIVIAHLHGLWEKRGKKDSLNRLNQANNIKKILKISTSSNDKIILCGDLNILPDSSLFQTLAKWQFKNLVQCYGYTDTRTSYYKKRIRYADYMLVTPGIKVSSFDVPEYPEISDHRPLLLEFD